MNQLQFDNLEVWEYDGIMAYIRPGSSDESVFSDNIERCDFAKHVDLKCKWLDLVLERIASCQTWNFGIGSRRLCLCMLPGGIDGDC